MKDSLFGITQLIDDSDEEEEATENPEGIFFIFQNVFKLVLIDLYRRTKQMEPIPRTKGEIFFKSENLKKETLLIKNNGI